MKSSIVRSRQYLIEASNMKDLAKRRSLIFAPIYYFGFVCGVFPYKYDNQKLYPNGDSKDDAFTKSTTGLFFCGIFMTVHAYGVGFTGYESYTAVQKYESCFEELCSMHVCRNVCAHFVILWMNCLANLTSTCTVLFLRWKNTRKCINEANNILKMSMHEYKFSLSHWIVTLFMTVHVTSFVLHWRNSGFNPLFLYTYMPLHLTQCLPIVTENVISVLLLIIENCYRSINAKIEEMADRKYFLVGEITGTLEYLTKYHWSVTDMTELVSDTFSLDFTIVGVTSTIRFIYFLFITLQYTARKSVINSDGGLMLPSYDAVIFFISVVGKFVYLCARCDRVVLQAKEVVSNLHTLQNKYRTECDERAENQVEEFLNQVRCREVSFKAYEFFTLNLHLICKVFGLTITYFIVLMQFQASHVN